MLRLCSASVRRSTESAQGLWQVPMCMRRGGVLPSLPALPLSTRALQAVECHVLTLCAGDVPVDSSPGTVLTCWLASASTGGLSRAAPRRRAGASGWPAAHVSASAVQTT